MADRHCFVCDIPVEGRVCTQCGRLPWDEPAEAMADSPPEQAPSVPVLDAPPPPGRILPPSPEPPDEHEPTIGRSLARFVPQRRWGAMAGIVAFAALVLALLQTPSAFDEVETPDTLAEIEAPEPPTSISSFARPSLDPWTTPEGAWAGLVRPDGQVVNVLVGNGPSIEVVTTVSDVLADGSTVHELPTGDLVVYTGDRVRISKIRLDPESIGRRVALAPNGRMLAVVDRSQQLWIWDAIQRPREGSTGQLALPSPAQALHWSPDSSLVGISFTNGRGYAVWDAHDGGLVASGGSDTLLALTSSSLAVWTGERIELRASDGSLLRTWTGLSVDLGSGIPPAQFDPKERLLAVQASSEDEEGAVTSGLWLLSVFGIQQERISDGHALARSFDWAGDGEALYYVSDGELNAWPVEATFATAPVSGAARTTPSFARGDRLRIYDHAIVPTGVLATLDGEGTYREQQLGSSPLLVESSQPIVGPTYAAVDLASEFQIGPECELVARTEGGIMDEPVTVFGDDAQLTVETVSGRICVLWPGHSLIREGRSLTVFDSQLLYNDDETVWALSGGLVEPVVYASDLSSDRLLAVAGLRESLLVLTETGGRGVLYHIPRWSSSLGTAVRTLSEFDAEPIIVAVLESPLASGRLLVAPDEATIAVAVDVEGVDVTHVLVSPPRQRLSPCTPPSVGICERARLVGRSLDFSPDGQWLLVARDEGQPVAFSTRGRGAIPLALDPLHRAAWISQ